MFLKSLFLNFKRKIGEPILIFLTVALAVATFLSALALRDSIEKEAIRSYRSLSGRAAAEAVYAGETPAFYLTGGSEELEELGAAAEKVGALYSGYSFYASAAAKRDSFARVYSTDVSELSSYNPISVYAGKIEPSRTGAILSRSFAKKIGVSLGGEFALSRYGGSQTVVLTAIAFAEEEGVFLSSDVLVSEAVSSRLVSLGDGVRVYNRFFIDFSEQKLKALGLGEKEAKALLSSEAPTFSIGSPVNDENVKTTLSYQSALLAVIAALVAAIGAVLIFTAVSLVMKNRISLCALFMSAGATHGRLFAYLCAEILLYALFGSAAGIGLSFGVSALFALAGSFSAGVISISPVLCLMGILFGVALAFFSALLPVLKLSRTSLYDALHYATPIAKDRYLPALVSAVLFVAFSVALALSGVRFSLVLGVFAFLSVFALLLFLAPLAVKGVCEIVMKLSEKGKAGALYVASSATHKQKHAYAGARIFAVSLAAVVAVASLCGEAEGQLASFDRLFKTDVSVTCSEDAAPEILESLRAEEGVGGAYLAYLETKCAVEGGDGTVTFVAVRAQEADRVLETKAFGFRFDAVAGARKAAVSRGFAMKRGLKIGDGFAVRLNGEYVPFTVSALTDTPITVVFSDLSGLGVMPNACLAATENAETFDRLSEKYSLVGAVTRIKDVFSYVTSLARSYLKIFKLFNVLVIVFAAIGYANALLASLRDRKREFRILSAVGAGKGDTAKILLIENAIVVLSSAALGAVFSVALLFVVQNMLKYFGLYFSLLY